jgi:hypothetical protein
MTLLQHGFFCAAVMGSASIPLEQHILIDIYRGAWGVEDLPDASRGSLNPKFKVEFDYFGLAPTGAQTARTCCLR